MTSDQANPGGNPEELKQMRLTLRTLLAYLDDVLEPGPAREIGNRIQETEYASQLVDRIQDVLRRRRVAAPDLSGPGAGLDPNTVAEYLDNTLPAKSVPDVERVCLESDVHLAEVAACHQILTLVLGEPLHVSEESRERLHALIPAALSNQPESQNQPAEKPSPESGKAPRQPAISRARRSKESRTPSTNGGGVAAPAKPGRFSETIPDYLKPKPFWQRALVPALVVTVLLVWLGLLVYDPSLLGNGTGDSEEVAAADQKTPGKTETSSKTTKTKAGQKTSAPDEEEDAPDETPAEPQPGESDTQPMPGMPIDEPPPEDIEEEKKPGEQELASNGKTTPPAEPPNDEPPDAETPEEPMPADAKKPDVDSPTTATAPRVLYTTKQANSVTKGMLLRYDAAKNEWGTLPQRALVMPGEKLACPEPLDAVFTVRNTDCEVTFIGGLLGSFQAAEPKAAFALNLEQGKVIFSRTEDAEGSVILLVQVGEDILLLELTEPNTRCGLEIIPKFPQGFEEGLGSNWYVGKLWVDTGRVRFLDRNKQRHVLAEQQALDISPREVPGDEFKPDPPVVQVDQILPDWFDRNERSVTFQTRQYMRQIYAAFNDAEIESDVTTVLLPLAKNEKTAPQVAELAGKTLAMTGCLRDVADILSLSESTPEELRKSTINETRRWLTRNPTKEDGQKLRAELGRNFHKETADSVYRLLWGYSKEDLQENATALELVNDLDDDNITVRTLAFMHLKELTGQTNNYRPLDSMFQRKSAIDRWREDVLDGDLFQ